MLCKKVICLFQPQFIQMWKTLYDMFQGDPQQQELYHSIATVGTLLLEIGEVGKKFYLQKEERSPCVSISESDESAIAKSNDNKKTVDELSEAKREGLDEKKDEADIQNMVEKATTKLAEASLKSHDSANDEETDSSENATTETTNKEEIDSSENAKTEHTVKRGERTVSTSSAKVDLEWSISFEQFLASMLTEPALVNYFETPVDLQEAVDKTRHRRLLMRQQSAPFEPANK